jgi:hypothetical protein
MLSTYSKEEGNEWEKDRRNKIPNVNIRQMIAQESVWKALLSSFCISRCHCLEVAKATNSHYTHSQLNVGY